MQYKIVVDKQSRTNPSEEKREYTIDIEELRVKGSVYDSINIEVDKTYITRRLSLSEYGVLTELDEPIIENLDEVNIQLFEGDNYIYLIDMTGNKFYAEYLVKNEFTDTYATKGEMNSVINQTAKSIEISVNQKLTSYSTIEQLNAAITTSAGEINLQVSKKLEAIQIGGTNLIPNSAPMDLNDYIISDTNAIELTLQDEETAPNKKCLRIRTLQALTSTAGIYIYPTQDSLEIDKDYCFSIWLKATANTTVTVGLGTFGRTFFDVTTEWKKFIFTFKATESNKVGFAIFLPTNTVAGRQVFAHSIKLEEGNKISGWSPAPEDNVGTREIIAAINMSPEEIQISANKISLEGKEINLTSDNISINSDFFQVSSEGKVTIIDNESSSSAFNFFIRNTETQDNLLMKPTWLMMDNPTGGDRIHLYRGDEYTRISATSNNYSVAIESSSSNSNAKITITDGNNTTTITQSGITTPTLTQTSRKNEKKNFEKLNNALDLINKIDIYKYNLKNEKDTDKKHIGFVIGKGYKYRKEVTNKDNTGAEIYSLTSLGIQGIKELDNRLTKLEKLLEVS